MKLKPMTEHFIHGYSCREGGFYVEIVRAEAGDWMIDVKEYQVSVFYKDGITYNQALCLATAFIKVYTK